MTKKSQDWQQLPQFISWEHYEAMGTEALTAMCDSLRDQIEVIRAQMTQSELIYGRTKRYRAWAAADHLLWCISGVLQKRSEALTQAPKDHTM